KPVSLGTQVADSLAAGQRRRMKQDAAGARKPHALRLPELGAQSVISRSSTIRLVDELFDLDPKSRLILDVGHVAHTGHDDQPRVRQPFGELRGRTRRVKQVELADQDEAWLPNQPQSIAGVMFGGGSSLAGKCIGILRPGGALSELDQPVDVLRLT